MNDLLKEWVRIDDACEIQEDGTIESFHCLDSGQDELEFIIERLRSLYASQNNGVHYERNTFKTWQIFMDTTQRGSTPFKRDTLSARL